MSSLTSGFVGRVDWPGVAIGLVLVGLLVGCRTTPIIDPEIIEVEGRITIRGNTPFEAPILETVQGNLYVLDMSEARRRALVTPLRARVRGRLYLDDWNGRPFAHLAILSLDGLPSQ